jgi:hypothetical protein
MAEKHGKPGVISRIRVRRAKGRNVAMSRQAMKKPPEGGLSLARTVEVSCLAGDDLLQLT